MLRKISHFSEIEFYYQIKNVLIIQYALSNLRILQESIFPS